jgi:hypothetical protein
MPECHEARECRPEMFRALEMPMPGMADVMQVPGYRSERRNAGRRHFIKSHLIPQNRFSYLRIDPKI